MLFALEVRIALISGPGQVSHDYNHVFVFSASIFDNIVL